MNIAFDLDAVLVDLREEEEKIFEKYNLKWYPTNNWSFSNYPEEIRKDIYKMFINPDIMCNLKPFDKAVELINYLKSEGNNVIIITARDKSIKDKTIEFAEKLFNIKCFVVDAGKSKLYIMKQNEIDLWIDDCPNELFFYMAEGIRCIMISNENTLYNHFKKSKVCHIESVEVLYNLIKQNNLLNLLLF